MRILFLTSRLPFPPVGGDRLRAYHLLEHLTHEHSVTLISFVESSDELRTATDHLPRLKRLVQIPLSRAVSYRNCIRGLFSRDPLQIHYYRSRRMREAVYDELRSGYDVIVCHLIRMAQYLPSGPGIRHARRPSRTDLGRDSARAASARVTLAVDRFVGPAAEDGDEGGVVRRRRG